MVILDHYYAKTDSFVYNRSRLLKGRDPKTFVVIDYTRTEDKNDIYKEDKPLGVSDRESFVVLGEDLHFADWAKDKNFVYYLKGHSNDSVIDRSPIADYDSFEAVSYEYARDRIQVYYKDSILREADPATFLYLGNSYAHDDKNVFFEDKVVCHYDSSSFKIFEHYYATDGKHIFFNGKVIENADITSFDVILFHGW